MGIPLYDELGIGPYAVNATDFRPGTSSGLRLACDLGSGFRVDGFTAEV